MVLFGGIDEQTNTLTDTWVWNGSYWREHFGIAGPPAGGRMVYDDRRSRVVLFGGSAGTWEWDGSSWMQVQPSGTPTIGTGNFAFDRRRDVAVFVGATNVNLPVETWEYLVGTAGAASWSPFGTGCAGSLGVPVLAPVASAQPTVGDSFAVAITGISPNVLVRPFGLLGGSNTSYLGTPLPLDLGFAGAPGCPLLVSPDVIVPLANSSGVATWNIAIPNSAGLLGGVFHQQGLVLEPGANMLGGITSNAGTATIGF